MAYIRSWNEATPTDSDAASTIDDLFRDLKVDLRERLDDIVADFTVDPVVPLGPGTHRARATRITNQSIPTGVLTAMNWPAESYDVGGLHDLVTNNDRITIPTGGDGLWLFGATIDWAASATGHREARLVKNGTLVWRELVESVSAVGIATITVLTFPPEEVVAADFYAIQVGQDSGGALDVRFSGSSFWALRLA